jgi:ApaG protein
MKSFLTNQASMNDSLMRGPYADLALVPATPWLSAPPPPVPSVLITEQRGVRSVLLGTYGKAAPWQWYVQWRGDRGWSSAVLPGATSVVPLPANGDANGHRACVNRVRWKVRLSRCHSAMRHPVVPAVPARLCSREDAPMAAEQCIDRITAGIRSPCVRPYLRERRTRCSVSRVRLPHRIENIGEQAAQLRTRRWLIHDESAGDGRRGEVCLGSRTDARYRARVSPLGVLKCPNGWMEGTYRFVRDDGSSFRRSFRAFRSRPNRMTPCQ